MRVETKLFLYLFVFFVPVTLIYGFWSQVEGADRRRGAGAHRGPCSPCQRLLLLDDRQEAAAATRRTTPAARSPSRRATTATSWRARGRRCGWPVPARSCSRASPSAGGCSSSVRSSAVVAVCLWVFESFSGEYSDLTRCYSAKGKDWCALPLRHSDRFLSRPLGPAVRSCGREHLKAPPSDRLACPPTVIPSPPS